MDYHISRSELIVILVLAAWEIVWKAMALWRAARNNHKGWFAALIIINSAGLLPIIYLVTNKEPNKARTN